MRWIQDGKLFLLNRETGEPIFGVEERPAPALDEEGREHLQETAAGPVQPPPPTSLLNGSSNDLI